MRAYSSEDVMDDHYGMITRAQAAAMVDVGESPTPDAQQGRTTVSGLNEFISMHKGDDAADGQAHAVDVEDTVYRVFNVQKPDGAGKRPSRNVVLGTEGNTVVLGLFDRLAESIDTDRIERGDTVFVKGALVDLRSGSLRGGDGTAISRLAHSRAMVTEFSALREGQKNIDVAGMVVEMGPTRHVSRLNSPGQVAVSDCALSDGSSTMPVSLWGSSALAAASVGINSTVKIEFCSVRVRNGSLEVYAGDLSRVLVLRRA
jgi:hypothetical protein